MVAAALVLVGTACGSGPTPARAARRPQVRPGIVYRVVGGRRLQLDAYFPAASRSRRSAVLVVHGGAWVAGGRAALAPEARSLADDGFTAFSIDYRLAPRDRFPAALDDVRAALAWIRAHAGDYGFDPDHIGAFGASAGGHLVALLATRGRHPGLAAVVSWSGPMDLTAAGAAREPGLAPAIATVLGCAPARCPRQALAASPMTQVSGTPPPMLAVNSTAELVSSTDLTELAAAVRGAGGDVETILLPGVLHAEQYRALVWTRTVAFLREHLQSR